MVNKRLMDELKDSNKYIWFNVLFQSIKLITNVFVTFQIGMLLQDTISGTYERSVTKTLIICGIMILIRFAAIIGANRMAFMAISDVKMTLRDKLYEKLLKIGTSYHEKVPTSQVVQIAAEGIEQLEVYVGRYLPQFYYSMVSPVLLFIIIGTFSLKTAIILLICVPLIPLSIMGFMKIAKRIMGKYWGTYANLGESFLENLQGLTTLKIYEADEARHKQMDKEAEGFRVITMKLLTMQLNSIILMNVIAFGGAAIAIIMATIEFSKGNIELWQAFAIIMLGAEFFIPLRLLGSYFHVAMNGTTACERLFKILDFEEKSIDENNKVFSAKNKDYAVALENLNFSYSEDKNILKDISFNIKKGEFTSIVGKSGCGKSTIASLIMGNLTGYNGSLYIDGYESKNIIEKDKMKKMTLVSHDSFIFKGTVRENLLMGKIDATDTELLEVLDKVKLKDFIISEGGLEFELLEQGSNISGGQKQRLAIARALLKNTDIYIFDEATSNIDVESENYIMDVINELAGIKTIVLISHRLANVVKSDNIYVMENGIIKESGKHDDLISNGRVYKEMYEQQQNLEKFGRGEVANA